MVAAGQAGNFTAEILEESNLHIKVGTGDKDLQKALVYDKATKELMMPSPLEINGDKGILPIYFKRSWR